VIAAAKTGSDNNNKNAVTQTVHTNNGRRLTIIPRHLIFQMVTIKLIAPAIEEIPAICNDEIAISTEAPECAKTPDIGGYIVQPTPAPASIKLDNNNKNNAGGNNQKLILFNLGKAISGAPIKIGTNQFPNPPIKIGITIKKIIIKACAVTTTLYS